MRNRRKPRTIIAVDFDGTLVNNKYPFISDPNMELIGFIKKNRYKYTWILYTCRTGKQLDYAVRYMKDEHGIKFDYVNENAPWIIEKYGNSRKIYADIYIDGHGVNPELFLMAGKDVEE